ncbi:MULTISPECIES: TonB family protein [unclassified Polaromonas]|uniref:energy transducer TonB n=1 Tax=unclassified Polaromonas TaxID=2638319 RepID=UPI000BDDB0A9|nr:MULTISPECIES: TonB family protein [unclassified Polaromonas]OYY36413.1 MAG: energy transducer TonB [Polaromonas sp. 35-63-35]OYZ22648.1 MAG: energy transducer TonB [Polaromonas sp. 16-63-31]OYZ81136.1 MAG: energy transducer TonB [Polaromonas sp. 24-63-21]OZA52642.1 MAG: energy transducer TonB [Polaromonas sp. 17-63-33]OZA88499.1 MAG: energy transducer TonB [Polaromonas sp. 39-63-25]
MKSPSTLQIALGVSLAVHAVLLTVRFVDPERFNRIFQDTPLEVILVNAKSSERPDQAKAIAQASLAGGGEAEKGRATSPLPPSALTELGDASEDAQRKVETMQEQQTMLLAQIKKQLAAMPPPDPKVASADPAQTEREEKRKQLIKILAEIERRINEENARPKKRYISPATREEVYAVYYDTLRRKIEEKGTVNFPEMAGKKLYGELTMILTVNHDGRVLSTEVAETSGNLTLDRRAQSIARSTGPFARFSEAMRRKADQIVVVSRFRFTRDETLETRLTER